MKQIVIFILTFSLSHGIYAQELDSLKAIMNNRNAGETQPAGEPEIYGPVKIEDENDEVNVKLMNKELVKVIDNSDSVYVKVGEKGKIQVIDQPDSTTILVGDREIKIVERGNDTQITMNRVDHKTHFNPKFRGHWAGFEWGLNNLLDKEFTLSREGDAVF